MDAPVRASIASSPRASLTSWQPPKIPIRSSRAADSAGCGTQGFASPLTWAPTPRVYATFVTVLPYVIGLGDHEVLIGSNEPLDVDLRAWKARLFSAPVRAYLGAEGVASTEWLLERLQPLHRGGRRFPERELNGDLFPRDEFATPY